MNSFGWDNFWRDQKQSFNTVMKIGTTFFAIQLERQFQLKPTDQILDYGCGPAFLADYLIPKNISVTGADINKSFITESQKHHPSCLFINITADAKTNKKILHDHLGTKQFDFIILLSIIQYFKNNNELEDVIRLLRYYLKKEGSLILADVLTKIPLLSRTLFLYCFTVLREVKLSLSFSLCFTSCFRITVSFQER